MKFERNREGYVITVPYWTLLLLAGWPTALLFYLDQRKIPPGHCNQCGYDLRTMTSGRCPECGTAAEGASCGAKGAAPAEKRIERLG